MNCLSDTDFNENYKTAVSKTYAFYNYFDHWIASMYSLYVARGNRTVSVSQSWVPSWDGLRMVTWDKEGLSLSPPDTFPKNMKSIASSFFLPLLHLIYCFLIKHTEENLSLLNFCSFVNNH